MDARNGSPIGNAWFFLALALFVAALAYVIVAVTTNLVLTSVSDFVPFLLLAAVGLIVLLGWWRDRAARASMEEKDRRERERLEGLLRERDKQMRQSQDDLDITKENEQAQRNKRRQMESRLKEKEQEMGRERYLRGRSEHAHQLEKNWRNELHQEVMRMSQERGALGDPSNVPAMVLRLAKTLVGAQKGLLLSRSDEDDDGKLDLLASEGFENDPEGSDVVQRFAEKVLERDQTVREERPEAEVGEKNSAVDDEIDNLVAIPIYLQDEFSGVLLCANNPEGFEDYEDEVLLAVGDHAGNALQSSRLQGELRASYLATVGVLAEAIEVKDPLLGGHSEEVSGYVFSVANQLDLPPNRREELVFGSLLHDIGKIGISERILLKPTALTPEERTVIELHPRIGCQLIQQVPALRPIAPAVLHHHERFDGGGYPSGLRGEQIPLEARLISVADSFSAMVSKRPYQDPMTPEEACQELERCAGTQFDPEIVQVFVEEVRRRPLTLQRGASEARDLELEVLLRGAEPVLGRGAFAIVDNLTLLYSRRHLHETVRVEAQRSAVQGHPFSVLLIELFGVEEVNRLLGYAAGDEEIQVAARAIEQAAARIGGTGYRYGGNRLAVLFPDVDEIAAGLLITKISLDLPDSTRARMAVATWRPGETGDDVISRARSGLR